MFPTPRRRKVEAQSQEDLLSLLGEDELDSVEKEIVEDLRAQQSLKKRSAYDFMFANKEEFQDEQVELAEWFRREIQRVARLKLLTFHSLRSPALLEKLARARAALVSHFGEGVFSESEDAEAEARVAGEYFL